MFLNSAVEMCNRMSRQMPNTVFHIVRQLKTDRYQVSIFPEMLKWRWELIQTYKNGIMTRQGVNTRSQELKHRGPDESRILHRKARSKLPSNQGALV